MEIGDELADQVVGIFGGAGDEKPPRLRRSGGEFARSVTVAVAEGGGRGIVVDAEFAQTAPHVSVAFRSHQGLLD